MKGRSVIPIESSSNVKRFDTVKEQRVSKNLAELRKRLFELSGSDEITNKDIINAMIAMTNIMAEKYEAK